MKEVRKEPNYKLLQLLGISCVILQTLTAVSGGDVKCSKSKRLTKEDIIPGLRAYLLRELGLEEEYNQTNYKSADTALSEEMLMESKLIAEIENKENSVSIKQQKTHFVETYRVNSTRTSLANSQLPSGKILQKQKYYLSFEAPTIRGHIDNIKLLLFQTQKSTSSDEEVLNMAEVAYTVHIGLKRTHIPLTTTALKDTNKGYKTVDVTTENPNWIKSIKKGKLELLLTIYREIDGEANNDKVYNAVEFNTDPTNHTISPRLVLLMKPERIGGAEDSGRHKRNQQEIEDYSCPANNTYRKCCRESLLIDLKKDIGIGYEIDPQTIDMGQCQGTCRLFSNFSGPSNSFYYHIARPTGIASCCVPDKFSPITLAIRKDERTELVLFKTLKIKSCLCV